MRTLSELAGLTGAQRKVVAASFLGWPLDACDFFILVFVLKDVALEFGTDVKPLPS
jgi:MFS transporter, SHS family, lactate transporter